MSSRVKKLGSRYDAQIGEISVLKVKLAQKDQEINSLKGSIKSLESDLRNVRNRHLETYSKLIQYTGDDSAELLHLGKGSISVKLPLRPSPYLQATGTNPITLDAARMVHHMVKSSMDNVSKVMEDIIGYQLRPYVTIELGDLDESVD